VTLWNPAAERQFGWSEEEVLGRPLPVIPEDLAEEFRHQLDTFRRGEKLAGVEARRRKKDGSTIEIGLWSAPLRDASGAIRATLVIAVDLTERKRIEQQLRETQKLESIGVLAGGIAHDFNNLLTGILGNMSLAMEQVPPGDPVRELLGRSLRSSERAAELVRQLLAYAGKGRFIVEPIDLSALVRELSPLLMTSIPKPVRFELELAAELPLIEGDFVQIEQIVINLATNAAEAIGNRAGTVLIRTGVRDVVAQNGELAPGRYVYLEVRDDGCGMDKATQAQIFDPFFSTKFTGRGLGLAAVSGIVRGHCGAIHVTSEPGKGSTFEVLLPAASRVPANAGGAKTGRESTHT
jgi:PAS domain S-box-containing protein